MAPYPDPFRVKDCSINILSLGKSAQNLRELRDHIASVSVESIGHHFYDTLLRPTFDDPEYRNDFALWARRQLHDLPLAERFGIIDPGDFQTLEDLRSFLLDLVEDRLAEATVVPQAERGREFYFLRSQYVIVDSASAAETPEQLGALVPRMSAGSIFYHFVEAQRRSPVGMDDFRAWLERWGPPYRPTVDHLARVDPYMWPLPELRSRLARCFEPAGNAR